MSKSPVTGKDRKYQSDIIADMIRMYGFEHITLNPGASYRGLHDSLVNYMDNSPEMMLCQHEKIAVQIAHGYAKATGKPMVAIVHDVVGMLHSVMGIYYAYIDRAPVFVIGATGPMDESKRRPYIDWTHTANVQGNALRDFVKWDYQPSSIHGVPDSFAKAYSVMMTEPTGPIYMCYDAWLQESPLTEEVQLPDPKAMRVPTPPAPAPGALEPIADILAKAEWPVLMAEYTGRNPQSFYDLVALSETLGAAVVDQDKRCNFPNQHPHAHLMTKREVLKDADALLCLDVRDWERPTHTLNSTSRQLEGLYPKNCVWMEIGFADIDISKWSMDYQPYQDYRHKVLADTAIAIPQLTDLVKARMDDAARKRAQERSKTLGEIKAKARGKWEQEVKDGWNNQPIALPRLAHEIWEQIKDEDYVLTASTLEEWANRLWTFDKPYRHAGKSLGTGTQIGISLGVALGHKGTGRLVVDIQPDGDLMFDTGALWWAKEYDIPILLVMYNNRAYYNDWEHQIRMAKLRGTPVERANIGMDLGKNPPDFAAVAKGFGWFAEGPVTNPNDIAGALKRAIDQVKKGGQALVDVIVEKR